MCLPLLDAQDAGSIDLEQTKKMVDTFLESGFTYLMLAKGDDIFGEHNLVSYHDSLQCGIYRNRNLCLEKEETHVVLVWFYSR